MVGVAELVLSVFLVVLLTGTSLVANLSIFAAYCRHTNLRTANNYLFMFLSGANVVVGLCYPLQCLVDAGVLRHRDACLPLASVLLAAGFCIAWTIVCLTVERYLTIVHPFAVQWMLTEARALCLAVVIGLYAAVAGLAVPLVVSSNSPEAVAAVAANGTDPGLNACRFANLVPSRGYRYFYLANRVVAIPLLLGLYLRIFLVARRHLRAIGLQVATQLPSLDGPSMSSQPGGGSPGAGGTARARRPQGQTTARWPREARLTLLVFAIALYQCVCWIPHTLLLMRDWSPPPILYTATHFVSYSTAAIYPIIYGVGKRDFRKALADLFGCGNRLDRLPRP